MLDGTKRLFPTEYKHFTASMIQAAEEGALPVCLHLNDIGNYTLKDFQDAFQDFTNDTCLAIEANMFLCDDCGKMHVLVEIDYPDVDEDIPVQ